MPSDRMVFFFAGDDEPLHYSLFDVGLPSDLEAGNKRKLPEGFFDVEEQDFIIGENVGRVRHV